MLQVAQGTERGQNEQLTVQTCKVVETPTRKGNAIDLTTNLRSQNERIYILPEIFVYDAVVLVLFVCLMVFNATFNNISAISWRSLMLVEETWGPGENHRPVASQ